ncbi:hypothetical protein GWI33_011991 [Rhynchophorus ferrugineus]|uniref:Uncharacterized protein n=1 Tax=Rhynchophorus ferrugineus TaxID=354439 RepID=A0A834IRY4_RHYFE|nr:hypothetical protein GWI33_011991 [Rhynchophorus ferrugineus]
MLNLRQCCGPTPGRFRNDFQRFRLENPYEFFTFRNGRRFSDRLAVAAVKNAQRGRGRNGPLRDQEPGIWPLRNGHQSFGQKQTWLGDHVRNQNGSNFGQCIVLRCDVGFCATNA